MTDIDKYVFETGLNKNTTSIIIGYLTDPPPLPYLQELVRRTWIILDDLNVCIYYSNHYFHRIYRSKISEHCRLFRTSNKRWIIVY